MRNLNIFTDGFTWQMGMDGVFVGSGIFKSGNPEKRATAIVKAVTHYNDAKMLAAVSEDLGEAMVGINSGDGYIMFSSRDSCAGCCRPSLSAVPPLSASMLKKQGGADAHDRRYGLHAGGAPSLVEAGEGGRCCQHI